MKAFSGLRMGIAPNRNQPSSSRLNFVLVLLALSVFINYIDRSNLSIAAPLLERELHISATQLGWLLSVFFWTYACMQIPVGWIVDRFDVKWVFTAGFFVWTAATAVTGLLHGFLALILVRIAVGAGESIAYPSYGKIFARCFPEERRGLANSVIGSGAALGPALGTLLGGMMVARFGWRPFFVSLGALGLLWLAPWITAMPSGISGERSHDGWSATKMLLRQRSLWGSCISLFANNYYLYFLVTWLPFYLIRGRGLTMHQMARLGGLVFFMAALSSIAMGKSSDWWILRGGSPTRVRKTFMIVGLTGVGTFLASSALLPPPYFMWTLCAAGFCHGLSTSNIWAATQTLAGPRMVGRWIGIQNFLGNLAGGIGPALTGWLVDITGHYRWPFFVAAGVAWIGASSWVLVVGRLEQVQWEFDAAPKNLEIASPEATVQQP
jgi:MFS transporter, ACS family, D-galactonate transporter